MADYDGNMIWQSEEKMGFYSATFELPDGSLALYDFPLALRYFDSQGRLQWREEFDDYAPGRSNLQGASNVSEYNVDRMIVGMPGNGCAVAHPDGRISAFDASGKLQWRSVPTGASQLICSDSSGNVYASVRGGSLYAFSSNGKLVWEHDKLAGLNSAPSVDPMGNLYIETISDLYCLDPNMPASQ